MMGRLSILDCFIEGQTNYQAVVFVFWPQYRRAGYQSPRHLQDPGSSVSIGFLFSSGNIFTSIYNTHFTLTGI